MIETDAAERGIAALTVAVAAIIEDAQKCAAAPLKAQSDYSQMSATLHRAGADITTLAAAIEVIGRRTEFY